MRSAFVAMMLAVAACGPQTETPADDGAQTSTTDGQASDTGEASTGTITTGAASTTADASTAGSSDDTAGGLLVPPEDVITSVSCLDDGRVSLLFEVFLGGLARACSPSPDEGLETLLLIGISDWDGMGGTLEVGMGQPVQAQYGSLGATVTGTITLELSAPSYPSFLTVDVTDGDTTLQGELDLAECLSHFEGTCEPATSG